MIFISNLSDAIGHNRRNALPSEGRYTFSENFETLLKDLRFNLMKNQDNPLIMKIMLQKKVTRQMENAFIFCYKLIQEILSYRV
ncbi:hypothetical protein MTBBW1_1610026 [Desulfamplus magnetovallimortis]|uniref:Uncharacterized protein n=1 Tax=Desulfamplus magnetovallimortis TaxID=1246637 RepID=A0A1W1H8V4_9BACT|nr:hypothetical protein MTBBW1_1610026 [Desulfamplus magnetovallimortis]